MEHFKVGGHVPITFDRFVRSAITLFLIVGGGYLIYSLSTVLLPFLVAWVLAYTLHPIVNFIEKRIHNRLIAIILTLIGTSAIIGGFIYLIVPPMVQEIIHLKDIALEYIQKGANNSTIPAPIQNFLAEHAQEYQVANFLQHEDLLSAIKEGLPKVWDFLWNTANIVINLACSLIAVLYLLFLLTDYEKYAKGWIKFIPHNRREFAIQLVQDVEQNMAGYFRGQSLVALSNCVMFSIGFYLIDFPVPIGLGCLIGVISFVPYLQVIGFLPATLLALLKAADSGENFGFLMIMILVVYVVVQILQDTIFTPHIMGRIMGLPPAMILLTLSVWGAIFGIVGLILALPITTLIVTYYRRYVIGDEPEEASENQNLQEEPSLEPNVSAETIQTQGNTPKDHQSDSPTENQHKH